MTASHIGRLRYLEYQKSSRQQLKQVAMTSGMPPVNTTASLPEQEEIVCEGYC
ncbi:uncharacterized protein GLRG_03563 [Colletotrichum graminicola M1.001]|uniref:Uncharacterized protein n=1 Tax=Colletotrichum graminicola (strain M1.001 / M2 / FGSC 10212) TaxID=645133 RepID=E3QBT0_COLGM|nr:uncharacterized protein GLRG_03563 [Colletotrichum graminicola M1.001]EFQ28419.1 hypothetical protein GLRG_03563 [Colletotrichum graminicola M1.001]